eukprot:TRINITY_DN114768_c0_g1_i1.p1 TRINITY_DN114768_c0_g1~~TRINITY_DN114768_c0_g1_i1.p1  ORF type:complete len:213 (-),score=54.73 TRINITY_DN114768_c0_g1_i1:286-924(-)
MLEGFKFNVSHQEIERILGEVEAWYETGHDQAGVEWLPLEGIKNFLFMDLGYEDVDEFEDAIQGTFEEFLDAFPHIEVKEEDGKSYLKMKEQVPGKPRKLTLSVQDSKQLLDTCLLKATDAKLLIPSLEFEIGLEQKRHIDSVYNHVITAYENLNNHAKLLGENSEERRNIEETVETLKALLDVEKPFEIVIEDPTGLSEFKPSDKVKVEDL